MMRFLVASTLFLFYQVVYAQQPKTGYSNSLDSAKEYLNELASIQSELDTAPDNIFLLSYRAYYYEKLGMYNEAFLDYDRVVVLDNGNSNSFLNRGVFYLHINKPELALADLDNAIEKNNFISKEDYNVAHFQKANAKLKSGAYAEAVTLYKKAMSLGYPYLDLHYNMAKALSALNENTTAIAEYSFCIKYDTVERIDYYVNRGVAKMGLGLADSALIDFNYALTLDSTSYQSYFNRGQCNATLKRYGMGIADFDKAIKYNSDLGEAYYNRAVLRIKMKNTTNICYDLKKAKSLAIPVPDTLINTYCK